MGFFGSWTTGEMANNDYTAANADVAPLPKGKQAATVKQRLGELRLRLQPKMKKRL